MSLYPALADVDVTLNYKGVILFFVVLYQIQGFVSYYTLTLGTRMADLWESKEYRCYFMDDINTRLKISLE